MIDISVVIPIYFNAGSIKKTCNLIDSIFEMHFSNLSYEFILVDDGSKDSSYQEMQEIEKEKKNVKLIQFTRNFGQVAAIYAGYEKATGKGILNIAADLQEPPQLIVDIITNFIEKEAKIIAGNRIGRDESLYRKYSSKFFYSIMKKLSFKNMPIGGFDIVLIHQEVKNTLLNLNESNPFWQGQLLWTGYSVKFIPYARLKRDIGKSRWTLSKKFKYLLDGVLNYSYLPLRVFSLIGILSFLFGLFYSLIIVIQYFLGKSPFNGWAPIMIVILLFSGLQLVMLGLIGEYLWRNLEQSKAKPKFIINENS